MGNMIVDYKRKYYSINETIFWNHLIMICSGYLTANRTFCKLYVLFIWIINLSWLTHLHFSLPVNHSCSIIVWAVDLRRQTQRRWLTLQWASPHLEHQTPQLIIVVLWTVWKCVCSASICCLVFLHTPMFYGS